MIEAVIGPVRLLRVLSGYGVSATELFRILNPSDKIDVTNAHLFIRIDCFELSFKFCHSGCASAHLPGGSTFRSIIIGFGSGFSSHFASIVAMSIDKQFDSAL